MDNRPRILLMCRDLDGAGRLCSQLTMAGWSTVEVVGPTEALTAVRMLDIDMVLMHLHEPAQADVEFIRHLRNAVPLAYLPVLVLADQVSQQQRCLCFDSGIDDVICRVQSLAEAISRIRGLLRIKELHDELTASRSALKESLHRERKLMAKLRRDNAQLQVLVTTDPLTRVRNVRSFREILFHEFNMTKRYDQPLSLLTLDVDHFKLVNDTYGHPSGDYVLKEMAVILKRSVRESDVVARMGGEEFGILLPRADLRRAAVFAERIRREVAARAFDVHGRRITITVSLGWATYPADPEITQPEMLAYFADQALLEAKESGRDRVVAFHQLAETVRLRLRRQYLQAAGGMQAGDPVPVQKL